MTEAIIVAIITGAMTFAGVLVANGKTQAVTEERLDEMFEMPKSRVYILLDEKERIVRIEGEYSLPSDLTGWVQIDEGYGDRFSLAQSHYLDGGLYTEQSIPRYKYEDGACALRSDTEIAEDVASLPPPAPYTCVICHRGGKMLTVDEANRKWQEYQAEG